MILAPAADLREGMTVARPIIVQGTVLLNVGSQLTAKHLQIFKAWGVTEAWIEGDNAGDAESAPDVESEEFRRIREAVDRRFAKSNEADEVISELKRIVIRRERALFDKAGPPAGEPK